MIAPSLETIEQFLESLFSYTEGWIALRSFPEAGKQGKPALRWIANDDQAASHVYQFACEAHQANRACYLIPGTVAAEGKAGSADVVQTGVLLVDIDTGDSEAKLGHLSAHLGKPSLIICSGGITETGARKLHVYWRLSEAAEGDDVVTACRLREQIALKVGGDTSFKSAHQPIRIAGSVYHKTAEARLVTIEERNGYEYHLGDLAEAIAHMPPMEGTDYKQPNLNWNDFNDVKPATEELMTMKVHEGGKDGITRFEAISTVIGYVIRRYHEGLIDQQEAWDEVWGYNLTCLRPAWTEERVRGEMKRLWEKHCRKYGAPTAYVPPEERQQDAPEIISYRLADLLDNPPAIPSDIIAPRILTPNSVMLFAGAPKVGKSDFLLSMFLHMAAGEQFLHMQPREPLRIFYLQMEIHGYYVSERIQSLAIGNDIKQRAAENMFITPRLRMLLDKDGVVRCAEHIRTRFGKRLPDVICIDPIRNVFDGGKPDASENDNSAMMFFLHERVERLRDLVNPEAGIIIVHHTRKQGKKQFEEDPLQAISGASALRGFYDSGLILFRPDEVSPERQLFTELRNGPEIPPCIIEKVDGRWIAKNIISERLVAKELGRKLDAERRRKYNVILQLLFSEAREGRMYTMNQFAEAYDRVQRSFKDSVYLDELVRKDKIELHFYRENMIIGREASASDHMRWDFCVLGAKSYVMQLSENVKRSIDYKIKKGEWYGPAPLGYLNQRDERGNSVIVVDQLRAPLLKRMFTEYASGAYTLGQMQQRCKEWGLRSKAGVELHKSTLYRIVQNPFYYGDMLIKGEIMQHCHEPLVSRNVWEDCQAVLRGWEKKPFLYGGKDFLFRGLLTCAVTGRVVSSDTKKKSYKNGTTAEFTYLVTWNPENPSKKFWVREDKVAAQVEAALERITIKDHEMMTAAIAAVKEANKAKQESHNREVGLLKKEHSEIQAKLDRLVDLLAEGVLPPDDYRNKREQLKKRQHDLVNLIHAYDDADNMFGSTMEKLMKVAMGAHKAFLSSSVEEKRELLNFVFSNLTLKGETLCYSYNFPFNNFENLDDCSKWRTG